MQKAIVRILRHLVEFVGPYLPYSLLNCLTARARWFSSLFIWSLYFRKFFSACFCGGVSLCDMGFCC